MKKRLFIRHPSEIPIDAQLINDNGIDHVSMLNISEGGIAFESVEELPLGATINIQIPHIDRSFNVTGKVVWIKKGSTNYTAGVTFTDKDEAFRVRMVEQLCHIQSYWKKNIQNGRNISIEEAADEWIMQFAENFPRD